MKIFTAMAFMALVGIQAHAMKCEGNGDCSYRAYTTKDDKGNRVVDLYGSNCDYSDDDGYAGQYPISSLVKKSDGKYTLDTGSQKIEMSCQ